MPSGLHNSKQDVVYFMHGNNQAGVSVFINSKTDNSNERFARMYSLGILVPLSMTRSRRTQTVFGRLGRSWCHVDNLKSLLK